jgi:hypothetical protein
MTTDGHFDADARTALFRAGEAPSERRRPRMAKGAGLAVSVGVHVLLLAGALASINNHELERRIARRGGDISAMTVSLVSLRGGARASPSQPQSSPAAQLFDRLAQEQPSPPQDPGARSQARSADDVFNDVQQGEEAYDPGARAGRRAADDRCVQAREQAIDAVDPARRPACRRPG